MFSFGTILNIDASGELGEIDWLSLTWKMTQTIAQARTLLVPSGMCGPLKIL